MQSQAEPATQESRELAGHVALVTGSGRGIGKAIALKLASMGANIAVNYNASESLAHDVVGEIQGLGVESAAFRADVSKTDQVEAMMTGAIETFGKVDILVNNSGIIRDKLLLRMTDEDWDTVIDTDLRGPFVCTRAVIRSMMRERWGRIINISSVVALAGNPGQSNYAAAKSGLTGFTYSVAKELAGRNVTANIVAPGYISTDVTENLPEDLKQQLNGSHPAWPSRPRLGDCGNGGVFVHGSRRVYHRPAHRR